MGQVLLQVNAASFQSSATMPKPYSAAGTTTPETGLEFTPASNQVAYYDFVMPADYVGAATVTVTHMFFSPTGVTSGNVVWENSVGAITPGDAQSVLTKAQATVNTAAAQTINGTASGLTSKANAMSSNLDSLAAGDKVKLAVKCTSASTISGNVVLSELVVSY